MLYRPGTILSIGTEDTTSGSDLIDAMIDDTENILADDGWNESMTLKRGTVTYDNVGQASISWQTIETFLGDWQPVTGQMIQEEKGLKVKSDARIICKTSSSANENDKIIRSNNDEFYVHYVRKYEDHFTIYLRKIEGAE
jgi:hypothetical protein